MKFLKSLFLAAAALMSSVQAAEDSFAFRATVQIDGQAVVPVEVVLGPDSVRTVDLENGISLEFTSPHSTLDGVQSMVRLLRKDGPAYHLLHTTRQTLIDGEPRENAYLFCGEQLIFMSPPRADRLVCEA